MSNDHGNMHWRNAGRKDCEIGLSSRVQFVPDAYQEAYEAGYAARYEEEQQLTNQVEEQEK